MRWIAAILLLSGVTFWLACEIESPSKSTVGHPTPTAWRLTPYGWQKTNSFTLHVVGDRETADHSLALPDPIILSLLVALVCIMALVAFSPFPLTWRTAQHAGNQPKLSTLELRSQAWLNEF